MRHEGERKREPTDWNTASKAAPRASNTLAFFSFVLAKIGATTDPLHLANSILNPNANASRQLAAKATQTTLASVILAARAVASSV